MEFPFNINNLFGGEISLVDNRLQPFRKSPGGSEYKKELNEVLDKMGIASAKAQGLRGPITCASRLGLSDHHVYIMKDREANGGQGAVVGFIKMGHKKLFVYDSQGGHHEMDPLCVLDFYVHESRQRMGCGRRLFDYMLQSENMKPCHLAVDRPSHKFSSFLNKHYGLKATINQVNNFVVFEGFFSNNPEKDKRKSSGLKPPLHPYRRQYNHQNEKSWTHTERPPHSQKTSPPSTEKQIEALKNIAVARPGSADGFQDPDRPGSGTRKIDSASAGIDGSSGRALGAQQGMYSRHITVSNDSKAEAPVSRGDRASPPLLSRDGPSQTFRELRGNPSAYQDRHGHLRLANSASSRTPATQPGPSTVNGPRSSNSQATTSATHGRTAVMDSSWNIMGVPSNVYRGQPTSSASKKYTHTRLW